MISDALVAHAAAADSAALAAAAGSAEEALACQRAALAVLADGWRSETGSAATTLLQQRCAEATDIVAALHRASEELSLLRQDWTDLSRGDQEAIRTDGAPVAEHRTVETTNRPDPVPASGVVSDVSAALAESPTRVPGEPVAAGPWPGQAWPGQAWPEQMGAGPWAAAPPAAPAPSPNWAPGGAAPAPADVGGALVGLVAQIAQALGSYGEGPVAPAAETSVDEPSAAAELSSPQRNSPEQINQGAGPPGPPGDAVPKGAVPQPLSTALRPSPELLAAERPPDPGVPPAPAQPPPVDPDAPAPPPPVDPDAPAPPPPVDPVPPPPVDSVPAAPGPVETAAVPMADAKTPCEIAADELAKVGE